MARLTSWIIASAIAACGLHAHGQSPCEAGWIEGDGVPGVSGYLTVLQPWDPDGAGANPPKLLLAGAFVSLGPTRANSIGTWDPATGAWAPLGDGVDGWIHCVLELPNGSLVVGGEFTLANDSTVRNIAKWDGAGWTRLGPSSPNNRVAGLAVLPDGHIVAGGRFTAIGSVAVQGLAEWDGSAWRPLGVRPTGSVSVLSSGAMTTLPSGELVAFGSFRLPNGNPVEAVAKWNGTGWDTLFQFPLGGDHGYQIRTMGEDDFIMVGSFQFTSGDQSPYGIARWTRGVWREVGTDFTRTIRSVSVLPTGDLLGCGSLFWYPGSGPGTAPIARWNGSVWVPVPGSRAAFGLTAELAAELPDHTLVAYGNSSQGTLKLPNDLARWNGSTWVPMARGISDAVNAIAIDSSGTTYIGGKFVHAGSVPASRIARRAPGGDWTAMGSGVNSEVRAIACMPSGAVAVAGDFLLSDGPQVSRVAKWNGSLWEDMTAGMTSGRVEALCVGPSGVLYAGGDLSLAAVPGRSGLARWDGSAWQATAFHLAGHVTDMVWLDDNRLAAAGDLLVNGGLSDLAIWDGTAWQNVPLPIGSTVHSLRRGNSGDLVVGGDFDVPGGAGSAGIGIWNSGVWRTLGTGLFSYVLDTLVMPDGDIIAVGDFVGIGSTSSPLQLHNIARWHDGTWSGVGSGADGRVLTVAHHPIDGTILIGGEFRRLNDRPGGYLAAFSLSGSPPRVVQHPETVRTCLGDTVVLHARAESPGEDVTYSWRRGSYEIPLAENSTAHSPELVLDNIQQLDRGGYVCVVTNACGSVQSAQGEVRICRADFNCSRTISVQDFFDYLAAYAAEDPSAEFDGGFGINTGDLFAFIAEYFRPC